MSNEKKGRKATELIAKLSNMTFKERNEFLQINAIAISEDENLTMTDYTEVLNQANKSIANSIKLQEVEGKQLSDAAFMEKLKLILGEEEEKKDE